jgi:type II restriction/modification system DNA methylase subunit YeeA
LNVKPISLAASYQKNSYYQLLEISCTGVYHMTPEQFITLWTDNTLTERGGAQGHFDDLCDLLGVDKPRDPDNYCFERGAKKTGGGEGWADVWKRGCFGWENKKPGRNLDTALKQLTDYALQLVNPPLLIVSDRERIIIHTAFTGYPDQPREIRINELTDPGTLQLLRWVFTDPQKLRPEKSTAAITEEAAAQFANIAKSMRGRGLDGQQVAHFLVQCLFCMFAEDEQVLPGSILTDLLKNAGSDTVKAANRIARLFAAMEQNGGEYGDHDIAWFNGGLFKIIDVPPLAPADLTALYAAAADMDWRAIDPTIFGTLFERGLDPTARAPLGAHYTDTATIAKLIRPLITEPLLAEWQAVKAVIATGQGKGPRSREYKEAQAAWHGYLERLHRFRVLDPACGSGNFLYLALKALRDVEKLVHIEAQEFGCAAELIMQTGPHNICGIEINEFAAELARVTVWIGDIQWCRRNGREIATNPILRALDSIEHRDALLNPDGSEASWPTVDVIVGNPPFLGDKMMRGELGDVYVEKLRKRYAGRVPGGADLVTYWFEKARVAVGANCVRPPLGGNDNNDGNRDSGACHAPLQKSFVRAGFVATNSIRQKRNRVVLERILESSRIFEAWSDENWVNEGAAVRVSLVCFGVGANGVRPGDGGDNDGDSNTGACHAPLLNGLPVAAIHADLTGSGSDGQSQDLTQARPLPANKERSFFGLCLAGPFKVDTATALHWLRDSGNPNGRPNSDVLRPIYNGSDITRRWAGNWVVDFAGLDQAEAADYLAPFGYVETTVKPVRVGNREAVRAEKWWRHGRRRPELRKALIGLSHFIATSETAKHRYFVKLPVEVAPEHKLIVIPSQLDLTLGILSSRIHCLWAIENGGRLGVGNDPVYNTSLCFETFPFPPDFDLQARIAPEGKVFHAIATAAADLNGWREKWLNPEGWLTWEITPQEQAAGFPARPVPLPEHATAWKKRTLTNLYNEMPAGLKLRQEALDKAVAAAYGWSDYTPEMVDDIILGRLLTLNLEQSESNP